MKKFILGFFTVAFLSSCLNAFAETTIITETRTWTPVPITVDTTKHTYVLKGTLPSTSEFYYSYPGYRCFAQKRDLAGVNVLVFNASVSGGSDIYCYPE